MAERQVSGEIAAVGWLDGSSGRFTGDIEGLYEGYRWGDLEEERAAVEFAHGSIALVLRHKHASRGRPRGENPFAGGKDPTADRPATAGPPPGRGQGGPPPSPGGPPGSGGEGMQPSSMATLMRDRPIRQTQCTFEVDGEASSGIYAGAGGELTLTVPNLKDAGYLVVSTDDGDLRLSFLEWSEGPNLVADLWVDGNKSTGIYRNARGELNFSLGIDASKGMAIGPYSGTIWLEQESAAS